MRRMADLSSCQHERRSSLGGCCLHVLQEQELVVTDMEVDVVVVVEELFVV
jgi:hypothetical protein